MTAQNVTVTNVADKPCVLHVNALRVDVGLGDERSIDVDLSPVRGSRFLIQPGRGVSLGFGADGMSTDCRPIARKVHVSFADAEPAVLRGAWVAVVAGNPACSLPAGTASDGLPLAVQLVGPIDGEERLFSVAAQLEQTRPWPLVAPVTTPA
jgi:hypothetical protein